MKRATAIPTGLNRDDLSLWITQNAKERGTKEKEIPYTEEEIEHFKESFILNGIEIQKIEVKKKEITDLIQNGSNEVTVEIAASRGLKSLKKENDNLAYKIDRGFYTTFYDVYGIPNEFEFTMDFYDIKGTFYEEFARPLTQSEKEQFFGRLFAAK